MKVTVYENGKKVKVSCSLDDAAKASKDHATVQRRLNTLPMSWTASRTRTSGTPAQHRRASTLEKRLGGDTPVSFAIADLVTLLSAYSYDRLSVAYPSVVGTVAFLDHAYGSGLFTGAVASFAD